MNSTKESVSNLFDLSSATKFMSDAIKIAYEYGKCSDNMTSYVQLFKHNDKNSKCDKNGVTLFSDQSVILKKFYADKGTKYQGDLCIGYHKLFIYNTGCFYVNTDNNTVTVDNNNKTVYIEDGNVFNLSFFEECCFYVLLISS
jgi:hypothetical protein